MDQEKLDFSVEIKYSDLKAEPSSEIAIDNLSLLYQEIKQNKNIDIPHTAQEIRTALKCTNCEKDEEKPVILQELSRVVPYITEDSKLVEWFISEGERLLADPATFMDREKFNAQALSYYCSYESFREIEADHMLKILSEFSVYNDSVRAAVSEGNLNAIRLLIKSGFNRWDIFIRSSLNEIHSNNLHKSYVIFENKGFTTQGMMMAWILALGEDELLQYRSPRDGIVQENITYTIKEWSNDPLVIACIESVRNNDNESQCSRNNNEKCQDAIEALRTHIFGNGDKPCALCEQACVNSHPTRLVKNFPTDLLEKGEDILICSTPCWIYLKAMSVVVYQRDEITFGAMCEMLSYGWEKPVETYDDEGSNQHSHKGFDLVLPLLVAASMGDFNAVRFVLFYLPPVVQLDYFSRTANTVGSYAAFSGQIAMATAFSRFGSCDHSIAVAAAHGGDFDNAFKLCQADVIINEASWEIESREDNQFSAWWYILRVASYQNREDILRQYLPKLLDFPRFDYIRPQTCIFINGIGGDWSIEHLLAASVHGDDEEGNSIKSIQYLIENVKDFDDTKFYTCIISQGASYEVVKQLLPLNYSPERLLEKTIVALKDYLQCDGKIKTLRFIGPVKLAFEMIKDGYKDGNESAKHCQKQAQRILDECAKISHPDHPECGVCNMAEILKIAIFELGGHESMKRTKIKTFLKNKHCANVMRIMAKFILSQVFLNSLLSDQPKQLTGSTLALYGLGIPFAPYHPYDQFSDDHLFAIYSYGRRHEFDQWGPTLWRRVESLVQGFDNVQDTILSEDVMNLIHDYLF